MPDHELDQDAPPRKRSHALMLVAAALLTCAGVSVVAWYFLGQPGAAPAEASAAAPAEAPRVRSGTVFVPLEQFTVNLADEGGERLAQIAVTLEVANADVEQSIKARMPAIRNAILLQLSSLESAQLLTLAGKEHLAQRIIALAARELGWQPPAGTSKAADAQTTGTKAAGTKAAGTKAGDAAPARRGPAGAAANPVAAVHFSHFIIQ